MKINSIWTERARDFYIDIAKYFSIIAMSVLYSFIIFGSVFFYYYLKFLQWLPPYFQTEIIASFVITLTLLQTSVRTFLKKADIIFLMPAEKELSSYFRTSMFYSALMDVIRILIMMIISSPLIRHSEINTIPFLLTFSGLIILNIRMAWIEQWLTGNLQKLVHSVIRSLLLFTTLYFMFTGMWKVAGFLLIINIIFWFYVFDKKAIGVNWEFLISKEERSLLNIYKFINIYIDVPHLKYSFKRRPFLGWWIKKTISYKQSSAYEYLFSHLFVRYNEFYYLYVRLTLVGLSINYFFPPYGWFVTFLLLFLSGYQLLPLHHSINESSHHYPVSTITVKQSFQKLLRSLLILQVLLLSLVSFIHIHPIKAIFIILMELLFIYWFVYFFASKRILKQE